MATFPFHDLDRPCLVVVAAVVLEQDAQKLQTMLGWKDHGLVVMEHGEALSYHSWAYDVVAAAVVVVVGAHKG